MASVILYFKPAVQCAVHFLHQQFFTNVMFPKVSFLITSTEEVFVFMRSVYTQLSIKVNRNSGCSFVGL